MRLPLMLEGYEFFDPDQPLEEYYGCLPHWRQEESFDHVVRSSESLERIRRYIRDHSRYWQCSRADT